MASGRAEIEVGAVERVFKYGAEVLADPNPGMSPERVRDVYAASRPEMANAAVGEPAVRADGRVEIAFTRQIGTKG